MSTATPAGWYRDPWGQSAQRFWDGAQWTPHVAPMGPAAPLRLPDGAPIYGPAIWLLALLPLLTAVTVWMIRFDASALADYLRATEHSSPGDGAPVPVLNPFTLYGPAYPAVMLVGLLLQATLIVLAYRDRQHLSDLGVPRPFHWAWAFLGSLVYVIGRSVVVRRLAAPRGYAPMWAAIAVTAVGLASSTAWAVVLMGTLTAQVPQFT